MASIVLRAAGGSRKSMPTLMPRSVSTGVSIRTLGLRGERRYSILDFGS